MNKELLKRILPNRRANLSETDLFYEKLNKAKLGNTNLISATLTDANLENTNYFYLEVLVDIRELAPIFNPGISGRR